MSTSLGFSDMQNVFLGLSVLYFSFIAVFPPRTMTKLVLAVPYMVLIVGRFWASVASFYVPKPYLDEFFHIPQAQKYCAGRYSEWDDKITTPPGLYLFSDLIARCSKVLTYIGFHSCDIQSLRSINALSLFILSILAIKTRRNIEARISERTTSIKAQAATIWTSQYAAHTALNICLCPVVFFFSGLYYTDVVSTTVVVGAFLNSLVRMGRERSSLASDLGTVAVGVVALFMRQTNVFWVVVFLGGLEAVHAVKVLKPERVEQPGGLADSNMGDLVKFYAWRCSLGEVYDPSLRLAGVDGYLVSILTIAIAIICNPLRVVRQIWPHITVLALFVAFVVWNGGVVLGDKSNHVATIHLAQMLYIWPFFAFFSAPLLVPTVLEITSVPLGYMGLAFKANNTPSLANTKAHSSSSSTVKIDAQNKNKKTVNMEDRLRNNIFKSLPFSLLFTLFTTLTSLAIVKFNTIVHPFTLADNRHYMFYVFRYTILLPGLARYLLVLPYGLCRWAVCNSLSGCHQLLLSPSKERKSCSNRPAVSGSDAPDVRATQDKMRLDALYHSTEPISASTAIIFILATTLSLITAPLVEPRYFIIPWVMYRLLVPAWRFPDNNDVSVKSTQSQLGRFFRSYDVRLIVETLWFVAINVVTICIFLTRPFQWKSEDGELLDGGRWQRFMW